MQLSLADDLKINTTKTKDNARVVLKRYLTWQRIAGKPVIDLKSPIIDDMPKAQNTINNTHSSLLNKIDAARERDDIIQALLSISTRSRLILYYTYCDTRDYTRIEIGEIINCSEDTVKVARSAALLEFAEAYRIQFGRGYLSRAGMMTLDTDEAKEYTSKELADEVAWVLSGSVKTYQKRLRKKNNQDWIKKLKR